MLQYLAESLKDRDQRVCTEARAALAQLAEHELEAAKAEACQSRSVSPTKGGDGSLPKTTHEAAPATAPTRRRTGIGASKQQRPSKPQQGRTAH